MNIHELRDLGCQFAGTLLAVGLAAFIAVAEAWIRGSKLRQQLFVQGCKDDR